MPNVYLIGMPGCGKSMLAKKAGRILGMKPYDLDKAIEKTSQKKISQIFDEEGETAFRDLETNELKKTMQMDWLVVATGGGVVMREKNIEYMKKSGLVVFINRPPRLILKTLKTDKRPLLQEDTKAKLLALFEQRYPFYKKACHVELKSVGTRKKVTQSLVELISAKLNLQLPKIQ